MTRLKLEDKIRDIPDFPKKGIIFKDITPLLQDARYFRQAIDQLAEPFLNQKVDLVVGIDARGFILAAALAYKLNAGLIIIRKKGKLPYKTIAKKYTLEYASETVEMHLDAIKPKQKILLVDDLLATGGTMEAAVDLVNEFKGKILGISFVINLKFLNGEKKLAGHKIRSLIEYE